MQVAGVDIDLGLSGAEKQPSQAPSVKGRCARRTLQ